MATVWPRQRKRSETNPHAPLAQRRNDALDNQTPMYHFQPVVIRRLKHQGPTTLSPVDVSHAATYTQFELPIRHHLATVPSSSIRTSPPPRAAAAASHGAPHRSHPTARCRGRKPHGSRGRASVCWRLHPAAIELGLFGEARGRETGTRLHGRIPRGRCPRPIGR